MKIWIGTTMLSGVVNGLLFLCASQLCGYPIRWRRFLGGILAVLIYTSLCISPICWRFGSVFWRCVSLCLVGIVVYGVRGGRVRVGLVYVFLALTLEGTAIGLMRGGASGLLAAVGILCLVCCFALRGSMGGRTLLPVELYHNGKRLRLTALQDTGNTLHDPVTGQRVLVIGADAAEELTGLTVHQLRRPVDSLESIPGLRLIPYHSIDQSGFLLAMRLDDVRIGKWRGSSVVAFAPEGLHRKGAYQAITGGTI